MSVQVCCSFVKQGVFDNCVSSYAVLAVFSMLQLRELGNVSKSTAKYTKPLL